MDAADANDEQTQQVGGIIVNLLRFGETVCTKCIVFTKLRQLIIGPGCRLTLMNR